MCKKKIYITCTKTAAIIENILQIIRSNNEILFSRNNSKKKKQKYNNAQKLLHLAKIFSQISLQEIPE